MMTAHTWPSDSKLKVIELRWFQHEGAGSTHEGGGTTLAQNIDLKWQHTCCRVSWVSARPEFQWCWSFTGPPFRESPGCEYGDHYSWILLLLFNRQSTVTLARPSLNGSVSNKSRITQIFHVFEKRQNFSNLYKNTSFYMWLRPGVYQISR